MKKIFSLIVTIYCLYLLPLSAQNVERPDSYNYSRGVEAYRNDNIKEALEYLNKEISENPENGYAYLWVGIARYRKEEYGRALTAVDLAIKNLPKKDKEYRSYAFALRADVYVSMENIDNALRDYATAIELAPERTKLYERRANLYYQLKKYSLADKDYQKLIALNQGSVMGYMGIGRNANAQKRYEDAVAQFNYVIKLASDYASGYSFRAESYIGLKQYNEAIDDVIKAMVIDGRDRKAFYQMQALADSAFVPLVVKLKVQKAKSTNKGMWAYNLGVVHEQKEKYAGAVAFYKESLANDSSPLAAYRIANCLDEMGDYVQALEYSNQAIALDSTDYDYIIQKAEIEDDAGMIKEAVADMNLFIAKYPEYYFGYYRRGWFKDHSGDIEGALEDYTTAITLNPNYAYTYLNRGILWKLKDNVSAAKEDFEEVLARDTVPNRNSCAQYAFYYLGQKEKAIEWQNRVLKESGEKGDYYDAACLYSVMGETEKAVKYLRASLEKGFRRFAHIKRDRDLNNIRELSSFKALIQEYELKHQEEVERVEEENVEYVEKVVEVPFTKDGTICKVKCKINNLPLHFIFDTGASDVSMSMVEATFMLKNDFLSPNDIIGRQNYLTADGEITEGTVVNLRNVDFGGLELNNIKVSIVKNQKAPLLLGQSVLNRLGKIEIDNGKRVLKVTYKERKLMYD